EDSAPKEKIEKEVEEKPETAPSKTGLNYQEKREFGALEVEIERLQNRKTSIENQFLAVEIAPEDIQKKSEELEEIIASLEEKEERWLELSMKLEG
ncbi:MAG: ABC transporter C-terminal domain-containing protein, partial [Polaribacter sp.]|nr:ABC transporter C-terminal domain-containing protein [Polaribacter sp.]